MTDHGGGGGDVGCGRGGDGGVWGRSGGSHRDWGPGQNYRQGEGWDDDAGGDEVSELPARVTGAVLAVSPGQHAGQRTEQVEDDDCEGVPVTATRC